MKHTKNINPKDGIGLTKTPLHLVSPIALTYASIAKYLGNVKYGAWNYRGSKIRASVYHAALMRHMLLWWSGEEMDSDGTPHLANAMACLEILIEGQYIGNLVDDRPPSVPLRPAMKDVEQMMRHINRTFGHMRPKHWTINDKVIAHATLPIAAQLLAMSRKDKKRKKMQKNGDARRKRAR